MRAGLFTSSITRGLGTPFGFALVRPAANGPVDGGPLAVPPVDETTDPKGGGTGSASDSAAVSASDSAAVSSSVSGSETATGTGTASGSFDGDVPPPSDEEGGD